MNQKIKVKSLLKHMSFWGGSFLCVVALTQVGFKEKSVAERRGVGLQQSEMDSRDDLDAGSGKSQETPERNSRDNPNAGDLNAGLREDRVLRAKKMLNSALFEAIRQGSLEGIQFLLERGADPCAEDRFGHSSIFLARCLERKFSDNFEFQKIVNYLSEWNAVEHEIDDYVIVETAKKIWGLEGGGWWELAKEVTKWLGIDIAVEKLKEGAGYLWGKTKSLFSPSPNLKEWKAACEATKEALQLKNEAYKYAEPFLKQAKPFEERVAGEEMALEEARKRYYKADAAFRKAEGHLSAVLDKYKWVMIMIFLGGMTPEGKREVEDARHEKEKAECELKEAKHELEETERRYENAKCDWKGLLARIDEAPNVKIYREADKNFEDKIFEEEKARMRLK